MLISSGEGRLGKSSCLLCFPAAEDGRTTLAWPGGGVWRWAGFSRVCVPATRPEVIERVASIHAAKTQLAGRARASQELGLGRHQVQEPECVHPSQTSWPPLGYLESFLPARIWGRPKRALCTTWVFCSGSVASTFGPEVRAPRRPHSHLWKAADDNSLTACPKKSVGLGCSLLGVQTDPALIPLTPK